jgi:hypothetical protein
LKQHGQIVLKKKKKSITHEKGLVEWPKVEALSSNPSTAKQKKKE